MPEITIKSPNIHCESCAASVKRVLLALPGVLSVSVNIQEKMVNVAFESPTKDEDIKRAMMEAGFPETGEV